MNTTPLDASKHINAFVYRFPASLSQRIEHDIFWYMFSRERALSRAVDRANAAISMAIADRRAREASVAAERARMDAVHESRAQRRATKAAQS